VIVTMIGPALTARGVECPPEGRIVDEAMLQEASPQRTAQAQSAEVETV